MRFRRRRRRLRLIAVALAAAAIGAPSAQAIDEEKLLQLGSARVQSSAHESVGATALNDRAHQPVRAVVDTGDVTLAAGGDEGFSWADAGVGAGAAAAGAMVAGAAMVALRQARRGRPAV